MGVGLGNPDDFAPFGRWWTRASGPLRLDESLDRLDGYWRGEFNPLRAAPADSRLGRGAVAPSPSDPAGVPLGRAVPDRSSRTEQLAALAEEARQARGNDDHFDLVVEVPPGTDVRQWAAAGATWVLTSFEPQPPSGWYGGRRGRPVTWVH